MTDGRALRILMLSADFSIPPYGGIAAHIVGLGAALAAAGHRVRVVVPGYGDAEETGSHAGFEIVYFRRCARPPYVRYPCLILRSRRFVRESLASFRPDVLHVHDFLHGPLIARPLVSRVPVVLTNHTSDFLDRAASWPGRVLLRRMFGRPHGVISVSPELHEASRLLRPGERELIASGVDTRLFRPGDAGSRPVADLGLAPGERAVLFVGRIHPVKGLHHLLDAFPAVLAAEPAARLVVVGDGAREHEADVRRRIRRLALEERVRLLGRVEHHALPAHYRAAELVVLPSRMEATSLTGLEALACGTPVVGSRVGGIPLIVEHGVNGLLTPVGEPAPLAEAIVHLLQDDDLRTRMSQAAHLRTHHDFDWTRIATRVTDFYRRVLEKGDIPI